MTIPPGSTSVARIFRVLDDSGAGVPDLEAADMPPVAWTGSDGVEHTITLVDLSDADADWVEGGFWGFSDGRVRMCLPDAMFASADTIELSAETSGKRLLAPPIEVRVDGVTITPFQANPSNPTTVTRDRAPIAQHSAPTDQWTISDLNLTGKTLRYVVYEITDANDEDSQLDDEVEGLWKYETGDGITFGLSGDDSIVTVQHDAENNGTAGDYRYVLWNVTDALALAWGKLPIKPAAFDV